MNDRPVYRALQKHLDSLPVGFPATVSGVEIKLLKSLFSPDEARIALGMSCEFLSLERIRDNLKTERVVSETSLRETLRAMASKRAILQRDSPEAWALLPFIVGMFELQVDRLSKDFLRDSASFAYQGFGVDYLTTGTAQTRIIPVGESVQPGHRIASYDEFRSLIENSGGSIAVIDCICRKASDLNGKPCTHTDRRELCVTFRDFAETAIREQCGRKISREEALEILRLNQEEGLIMRPSNEREPQFICSCCSDCCGLMGFLKFFRRPADFVQSNYSASIDESVCTGCGSCVKACHMSAITLERGRGGRVLAHRCIGCGLCVPRCGATAVTLKPKAGHVIPPKTTGELYTKLVETRPSGLRKILTVSGGILGIPQRPFGTSSTGAPERKE